MTAESLRRDQSARILDAIARVTALGYSVRFDHGEVTVSRPGDTSCTVVRSDVRDAAAHALMPLLIELDMATERVSAAE